MSQLPTYHLPGDNNCDSGIYTHFRPVSAGTILLSPVRANKLYENGWPETPHLSRHNLGSPFLAKFIHSAKLSLSISRLLYQPWPNDPAQEKQYTGAVDGALADSSMECFKATDGDSNANIGYIVLARKMATKEDSIAPAQSEGSYND